MKSLLLTAALFLAGGLAAAEFGQVAPPLDVDRVIGGKRFRIEDMTGKKMVVLHFWTRDCRPCDNAVPLIAEAARRFGGSTVFLAVGDSDARSVEEYPQLEALTIPAAVDHLSKTADAYLRETDRLPTDVVIGRDGRVAWIGPTVELPRVLEEINAGKYDIRAAIDLDSFNQKMVRLLKEKDYEGAFAAVQERRKTFPDDLGLAIGAANILAGQLERTDDALKLLDDCIKRFPDEFPLYNAKLRILHFGGQPDPRVVPIYHAIAERFAAAKPMLLVQLADNLLKAPPGRYPLLSSYELAAAAWKSEGFRSDAERGRAAAALARCYYALGMIDEAVKLQNRSVMWLRGAPDEKRLIRDLALYRDAQETAREVRRREVKK